METVKKEVKNNDNNNGKDKKRKKGIIITGGVIGVAAVGAVTAALLVKSCQENDGVNYTISHANLSQAQVTELAFEYAEGSTIHITSFDSATKQIHGTVTDAKATGGKVNTANVTGAGYDGNDNKDGQIDAKNPAVIDHALFTGEFDGTFNGDVKSITGDATSGFAISGTKWSVSNASASDASFKEFFATSGAIVDAVVNPSNPSSQPGNNSAPTNIPLTPAQQQQAAQNGVQTSINNLINTPTPAGQTPQTPVQKVTTAINNAGYQLADPAIPPKQVASSSQPITPATPYVASVIPQAPTSSTTPNTPAATPLTISVVVPPVVDHVADFQDDTKTNSVTNKQLDENSWNALKPADFTLTADAPSGTTIASAKTSVQAVPTQDGNIPYTITLSYNGTTKDVTVNVPFKAPSQDVLNQRELDKVTIVSNVTLHETGYGQVDSTNLAWTTTLDRTNANANSDNFNVSNLPANAVISSFTAPKNVIEPTQDDVVTFKTTLTLGNATREITVPVDFKTPTQDQKDLAALNAAAVSTSKTLNEANWNVLDANDVKVLSSNTNITVSKLGLVTSSIPSTDTNVEYKVTLTLGTQTRDVTVQVPYKDLLNSNLTVSTTKEVNDTNWDKLTKADFTLSSTTPGLTISKVTPPATMPATSGNVDYKVEVSLGNEKQEFTTSVKFNKLDGKISTTKTVDEQTWDKLTQADFDLAIDSKFANAYISEVEAPATKPTADGDITYKVTYTYGTFTDVQNITVPFALSDAYHLANTNITPKAGFALNYHNWDKLTAADLDVPANVSITDTDIKAVSSKPDPHNKTITTITYEVKVKVGQTETTKTINVPYGAPDIRTVNYWTYGNNTYYDYNKALAAAKTGEEAKITSAKKYFYKNVSYDTQALAEAEQTKDITAQIIKTTYDDSITQPANGQPAPTQTLTTVYVFGGKVYDTLVNAQAAWTSAHPDVAEKAGSFNVQYEGTTVKSITIDSANKSVYVSESAALADAQGKFTWKYVTTAGQAAQAEQNPTAATLPTTSGTTIKVDNDSYTYHTVGDVTGASTSTTGKKYDAASIKSAIEGAVSTTADDSKSVNIDGNVYKFENVIEKHAQAYTLDELAKEVGNHKVTIDGKDYWNVNATDQSNHFGLLRKDANNSIVAPANMPFDFAGQINSIGGIISADAEQIQEGDPHDTRSQFATSFVSNDMLVKLDSWLNNALNRLKNATDLTVLDNWTGTGEDNWMWFWKTFAKTAVASYVAQSGKDIKVNDIFDGDNNEAITTAPAKPAQFWTNIHDMALALGVSQDKANIFIDANNSKNSQFTLSEYYQYGDKMKGIAFATSKPSQVFDSSRTTQMSSSSDLKTRSISPVDSIRLLLSYWNIYTQRMVAIGKGAVFSTDMILLQAGYSAYEKMNYALKKFTPAATGDSGNASPEGMSSLQNSLFDVHYSHPLMLSLGSKEDWENTSLFKSNSSTTIPSTPIGPLTRANPKMPSVPNVFTITDMVPNLKTDIPFFILDPSYTVDISGDSINTKDQYWLKYAQDNLASKIGAVRNLKIKLNNDEYLLTIFNQNSLDANAVGLYAQEPTLTTDSYSLGHLWVVDANKFDRTKQASASNGLLTPVDKKVIPSGPFYMLNNDKYDWTSQEQKTGTTYVPASRKWDVALPTTGDYYKVTDKTKIQNGYDYTTTLQDGVEDYLNTVVNALPATEGWYKDNNTAAGTSPVTLGGTYYVKKGKHDSDHEYVTDKTQGEGYAPATTSSKVDQYQLQYDGADVASVTQNVTWTTTTKPNAPTIDTSKVSIDSFDAYVAAVTHDVSTESTNDIKSQQITSDIKFVTDAVNKHAPLDASQVTPYTPSSTTWDGWVYDGKIYDTEDAAKTVFKAVAANAVSDQDLNLVYDGTTYGTEALAKQAAEANSIKLVDASKQTEEQENGNKFVPSLKVDFILATRDPKDIY